jgi:glycyl-tRNA synthetase
MPPPARLETIASLCKRRGFIFQSSEVYGGINGFWDYGPLGCELKRNIKDAWWRSMVRLREDIVGLDATIIMHPAIWKASGHLDTFADPMSTCRHCRKLMRADQIWEILADGVLGADLADLYAAGHPDLERVKAWTKGHGRGKAPNLAVVRGNRQDEFLAAIAAPLAAAPDLAAFYALLAGSTAAAPVLPCPYCGGELTEPRPFNLMFKTVVGPVDDPSNIAYLRPETAQAIFAQFQNVLATSRQTVPFGIAQTGKSFRNEVTPRNYTFRSREFEQMELEYFIRPDEAVELVCGKVTTLAERPDLSAPQPGWGWEVWHKYWVEQRMAWYRAIGLPAASLVEYWQKPEELAHYARACVDIQFAFPFGVQELEGIAARGDFDLSQHQAHAGKSMEVFDEPLKLAAAKLDDAGRAAFADKVAAQWAGRGKSAEDGRAFAGRLFEGRYVPHVIEPSAGVDRLALALLCNAYAEEQVADEKGKSETRTLLRFGPAVAPVKVAVFPLVKNRPELYAKARQVFERLRRRWPCFWDESGAIGRRYRRQDEAGTPFCVTVDFQTLEDGTVTLRDRDTMKQERLTIEALGVRLDDALLG